MMHWNYKLITVLWWWISNKAGCSHSRSTVLLTADMEHPKEALEPNTREPVRERDWMDVGLREVVVCVCAWGGGGVECLCAGLIILSTEWAHITKDLLSLAGELLQSRNSAQPFSLPGDRNMWPSSAFGREVQTTTNPVFVSLSLSLAYKAASVSGGWRTLPLTGPCFAVSLLSISNLSPPGTATYSLCT